MVVESSSQMVSEKPVKVLNVELLISRTLMVINISEGTHHTQRDAQIRWKLWPKQLSILCLSKQLEIVPHICPRRTYLKRQ
jgi:hypothetical protein